MEQAPAVAWDGAEERRVGEEGRSRRSPYPKNNVLIPNAQNAELKKMLVDVKPAFQAHLEHAEKSLAALDKH